MTPEHQVGLRAAVFRQTARDPAWLGYWLHSHQEHEGLDAAGLPEKAGAQRAVLRRSRVAGECD